jgi:hypothetical protein
VCGREGSPSDARGLGRRGGRVAPAACLGPVGDKPTGGSTVFAWGAPIALGLLEPGRTRTNAGCGEDAWEPNGGRGVGKLVLRPRGHTRAFVALAYPDCSDQNRMREERAGVRGELWPCRSQGTNTGNHAEALRLDLQNKISEIGRLSRRSAHSIRVSARAVAEFADESFSAVSGCAACGVCGRRAGRESCRRRCASPGDWCILMADVRGSCHAHHASCAAGGRE